jgi:hypothetical protein
MEAGENPWAKAFAGVLLALAIVGLIVGYAIID